MGLNRRRLVYVNVTQAEMDAINQQRGSMPLCRWLARRLKLSESYFYYDRPVRSLRLSVYMTDTEHVQLKADARRSGLSMMHLLRWMLDLDYHQDHCACGACGWCKNKRYRREWDRKRKGKSPEVSDEELDRRALQDTRFFRDGR